MGIFDIHSKKEIQKEIDHYPRKVISSFIAIFEHYENIVAFHNDLVKDGYHFAYPAETQRLVRVYREYLLERTSFTEDYIVHHKRVLTGLDRGAFSEYYFKGFIPNDAKLWRLVEAEFLDDGGDDGYLRGRIKVIGDRILRWEPPILRAEV